VVSLQTEQKRMNIKENIAALLFKIPADVGTVNNGTQLVGACAVANSKGVMVGLNTTGPELARIEEALGFLEGYL